MIEKVGIETSIPLAELRALETDRDRLREALERIAKSDWKQGPASRFVLIAQEALGPDADTSRNHAGPGS